MKKHIITLGLSICVQMVAQEIISPTRVSQIAIERIYPQEQALLLEYESFRLSADSGTLMHDLHLQFSVLSSRQSAPMPSNMVNATGDFAEAYRLLPNGEHFQEPAKISLPYNPSSVPMGYKAEDVYSYYYDESSAQWTRLERCSVDTVAHIITSYTTHFTDFANAVIKVPDMPESKAFVPTALTDMPDVNPLQGIPMIAAPTANNRGTAELSYPIELPKGRRGMQPNVDLHYSSAGGNGILGVGWSMQTPAITIDTRWGVPRYSDELETEAYLLNGEQLLLQIEESAYPLLHQSGEQGFAKRQYGKVMYKVRDKRNQERIVRYGDRMDSIWWCVTDRSGTKYYYGFDPLNNQMAESAIIRTDDDRIGNWYLTYVVDVNGNYIRYTYSQSSNVVYLDKIDYTGNAVTQTAPTYSVIFCYTNREDKSSNGRLGVLQKQTRLLKNIAVLYADGISNHPVPINQYQLTYENDWHSQHKSRLISITKYDTLSACECPVYLTEDDILQQKESWESLSNYLNSNSQDFDVSMLDDVADDKLPGSITRFTYENALPVNKIYQQGKDISRKVPLSSSQRTSWSVGGTAAVGFGYNTAITSFSAGGNYSYQRSTDEVKSTLLDMDGDGLLDLVYEENHRIKYFRQLENNTFEQSGYEIPGLHTMSRDVSSSHNFGVQADFDALLNHDSDGLQANISYSPTIESTYTDIYFSDINADGLPDLIYKDTILVNHLVNGRPSFLPIDANQTTPVNNSPCGTIHRTGSVDERLECQTWWVLDTIICRKMQVQSNGSNNPGDWPFLSEAYHGNIRPKYQVITQSTADERFEKFTSLLKDEFFEAHQPLQSITFADSCTSSYTIAYQPEWNDRNHKVEVVGDSMYVYHLESECTEEEVYPNVDIVRVWVAPQSGSISLASSIRLLQDSSLSRHLSRKADGVKYYIQHNQELVDSGYISADDYTIHMRTYSRQVTKNDVFLFRLSAGNNRRFDDVAWEQSIRLNGNSYHSAEDFVCSGDVRFMAPDSGFVKVGYALTNNQTLPYQIHVKYNNAELTSNQLNTYFKVNAGDSIYFSMDYPHNSPEPQWSKLIVRPYVDFISLDSAISDTLHYFPDIKIHCTSILPETNTYRKLFGLLHKGWGQFAFNNVDKENIINLSELYNAEDESADRVKSQLNRYRQNKLTRDWNARLRNDSSAFGMDATSEAFSDSLCNSYVDSIRQYDPLSNGSKWIAMHSNSRQYRWEAYGNLGCLGDTLHSTSQHFDEGTVDKESANRESVEYDSAIPIQRGSSPVTTIRKKTSSVQHIISVGFGICAGKNFGFNKNFSWGRHHINMDYMDMNGDGFPDFVGETSIQYTTPWGGLDSRVTPTGQKVRYNKVTADGEGASGGQTRNVSEISGNGQTQSKLNRALSWNAGGSNSHSWNHSKISYVDINADGLPDIIDIAADSVWYNLGYAFSEGEKIPSDLFINEGSSHTISINGDGSFSTSNVADVVKNLEQAQNTHKTIHQYSISAGISTSFTENDIQSQMSDIDGDGLIDIVLCEPSGMKVRLWNNGVLDGEASLASNQLKSFSFNVGALVSLTAGFTLSAFPIKFTFGVQSSPWSSSWTYNHTMLMDLNADGYVDLIESKGDDDLIVYYNQNGSRPVNLLTNIVNPTGQSISIDYKQTKPSVQQRGCTWVMNAIVDEIDSYDATARLVKEIQYQRPNHDNFEKTDYGFENVTTIDNRNKIVEVSYYNTDFIRKGEVRSDLLRDNDGMYIGHRHEMTYASAEDDELTSLCNDASLHLQSESFWTDYYQDTSLMLSTKYTLQYDEWHNVIKRYNEGDVAVSGDEWTQMITYYSPANNRWRHNLISLPFEEKVYSKWGLMRKSTCYYDSLGHPSVIVKEDSIRHIEAATYMDYDVLGNICGLLLPDDGTGSHPWLRYEYDYLTGTYPVRITNQFNETQLMQYDIRWGLPTIIIDPSGYGILYTYDYMGRLESVTSPRDYLTNAPLPTLQYYYRLPYHDILNNTQSVNLPYVIQIGASEGVVAVESTVFDQRGQQLQSRHLQEIDDKLTWVTDGFVVRDAFYRTIETYLPEMTTTKLDEVQQPFNSTLYNMLSYDAMDRVVETTHADNTSLLNTYSFDKDGSGNLRLAITTKDENNITVRQLWSPQEQVVQSIAGDSSVTRYYYNCIGELIIVEDADGYKSTYNYDMLGNRIERIHPDAGVTEWQYAPLGNLTSVQTTNLRLSGDSITYQYLYGRLEGIHYPLHPENNVKYIYDSFGRLRLREDGTGSEEFSYDELGNLAQSLRRIVIPTENNAYMFLTCFTYDSFGRMKSIRYPDGELVQYAYSTGGLLKSVIGQKQGATRKYLSDRKYDAQGRVVEQTYGNNVQTQHVYDPQRQWLSHLSTFSNYTQDWLQDITYKYDAAGNITDIDQSAPPVSNGLGGKYDNHYQYDKQYRLIASKGSGDFTYSFSANYSPTGRFGKKYTATNAFASDLLFGYDKSRLTHQPRTVYDSGNGTMNHFWDANGNLSQIIDCKHDAARLHEWDEENRLRFVLGEKYAGYYGYDANGERVYKLTGSSSMDDVNAGSIKAQAIFDDAVLYPNPYIVVTPKGYTKHYYAGTERLATAIGGGGFDEMTSAIDMLQTNHDWDIVESFSDYYLNEDPFNYQQIISKSEPTEDIFGNAKPDLEYQCQPVELVLVDVYTSQDILLGSISTNQQVFSEEDDVYFYHGDHLGSANWITDADSNPIQYIHYAPYGEQIANQQTIGYDERFKFTGKERDWETGYDYFGARFYDYRKGFWNSVDPLADKNISNSPYMYCSGNPIMLVDPDGRDTLFVMSNGCVKDYTDTDGGQDVINVVKNDGTIIGVYTMPENTMSLIMNKKEEDKTSFVVCIEGYEIGLEAYIFIAETISGTVEWALVQDGIVGRVKTYIGTNNLQGKTSIPSIIIKTIIPDDANIIHVSHSHPTNPKYTTGVDDVNAEKMKNDAGNKNKFVKEAIFSIYSVSTHEFVEIK